MARLFFINQFGGAAGNRTPVRKVTYYSSTSIVYPNFLRPLELEVKRKIF